MSDNPKSNLARRVITRFLGADAETEFSVTYRVLASIIIEELDRAGFFIPNGPPEPVEGPVASRARALPAPCPFCGSTQVILFQLNPTLSGGWLVKCLKCAIRIENYASEAAALAAWNRRPDPAPAIPADFEGDIKISQMVETDLAAERRQTFKDLARFWSVSGDGPGDGFQIEILDDLDDGSPVIEYIPAGAPAPEASAEALRDNLAELVELAREIGADKVFIARGLSVAALNRIGLDWIDDLALGQGELFVILRFAGSDGEPAGVEVIKDEG